MNAGMRRLWQAMVARVIQSPEESEARRRVRFYTFFIVLAAPYMFAYGVFDVVRGDYVLAGLVFATLAGMTAGWLRLRAGHDDRLVYRANALLFGLLILYMVAVGGEAGSKSLWIYVYPLVLVFVLGVLEGLIWAGALLVCAAGLLWQIVPGLTVYGYAEPFKIRLVSMYVALAIATTAFEYSRRRYRDAMWQEREKLARETERLGEQIRERERTEREKEVLIRELQDTLAQVKTLRGLVPICASCHRIRDDEGYWNQLETYLRHHSDAQFSHGVCPTCMEALYPERESDSVKGV